jgi:NAD(P)-dependent dehydrogenase (short-subunit alcohol dehydrogenase family)
MNNAINQPQTILVLGGGSDIGQAIVHRLASPALRTVILAGRAAPIDMTTPLDGDASVVSVTFDALDHAGHDAFVQEMAAEYGDLVIVVGHDRTLRAARAAAKCGRRPQRREAWARGLPCAAVPFYPGSTAGAAA